MATETAAFERASIVAFYDAIQNGSKLKPKQDRKLIYKHINPFIQKYPKENEKEYM